MFTQLIKERDELLVKYADCPEICAQIWQSFIETAHIMIENAKLSLKSDSL